MSKAKWLKRKEASFLNPNRIKKIKKTYVIANGKTIY